MSQSSHMERAPEAHIALVGRFRDGGYPADVDLNPSPWKRILLMSAVIPYLWWRLYGHTPDGREAQR